MPGRRNGAEMSKELFVSSTPHETKVAIQEDDQLAEIYFERENEYTLAGSIYKGKVTRVLPGMQSAFVDLGLERDAFLYVTDFLEEQEDLEEFDTVATQPHERGPRGGDAPQAAQHAEPIMDPHRELPPAEGIAEPGNVDRGNMDRGNMDRGNTDRGRGQRDWNERQPASNAATIGEAGGDTPRPD